MKFCTASISWALAPLVSAGAAQRSRSILPPHPRTSRACQRPSICAAMPPGTRTPYCKRRPFHGADSFAASLNARGAGSLARGRRGTHQRRSLHRPRRGAQAAGTVSTGWAAAALRRARPADLLCRPRSGLTRPCRGRSGPHHQLPYGRLYPRPAGRRAAGHDG